MLIAVIVYLVVGAVTVGATSYLWICGAEGWSLLRTIFRVVCATLLAPICLIIGFVRGIYRALH